MAQCAGPRADAASALRLLALHAGQFLLLEFASALLLLAQFLLAYRLEFLAAGVDIERERRRHRRFRLAARALELDVQAQLVRRVGVADRFLVRDPAFVVELEQRPVER